MRIQVITMREKVFAGRDGVEVSKFSAACAFDAFDVTAIDFQSENFWKNAKNNLDGVNSRNDLQTLASMINQSTSCNVLVLLPQNNKYVYDLAYGGYSGSKSYQHSKPLKDMIDQISSHVFSYVLSPVPDLAFGRSTTIINGKRYESDFFVPSQFESQVVSAARSDAGDITAFVTQDERFVTTMFVPDAESLLGIVDLFGLREDGSRDLPAWLEDVSFLDESDLREELTEVENQAADLRMRAAGIEDKLLGYTQKKAVLCLKGAPLEDTVREMLAEILDVEDAFIDTKEEDFLYESPSVDICFEIKGSVGGLKRHHVSKTFDHAQMHADVLEGRGVKKDSKAVLVFSSEIEKPPKERSPFPEGQIKIAERNEVAILSGETFLRCYEAKLQGRLDAMGFLDLINCQAGLIEYPPSKQHDDIDE